MLGEVGGERWENGLDFVCVCLVFVFVFVVVCNFP